MSTTTITDGTGQGTVAGVDRNNRLETNAVTQSVEHWANVNQGRSFSLNFTATPTGAGDCFFYFKNTNSDRVVIFEGFGIRAASAEAIEVYLRNTGTPSGGSTVVPVNLNTRSGLALTSTIQSGNDITGLTQQDMAYRAYFGGGNSTDTFNFDQDIVIGPQQTLCLYAVTGGVALDGFLDCYSLRIDEV